VRVGEEEDNREGNGQDDAERREVAGEGGAGEGKEGAGEERGEVGVPESLEHQRSKDYLKEYVGHYDFMVQECGRLCGDRLFKTTEPTDEVKLEHRVMLDNKWYTYDVAIFRKNTLWFAIEVYQRHKTGHEKINVSERHGIRVVEVTTREVLSSLPRLERAVEKGATVTLTNQNMTVAAPCWKCASRPKECDKLLLYDESRVDGHEQAAKGWERADPTGVGDAAQTKRKREVGHATGGEKGSEKTTKKRRTASERVERQGAQGQESILAGEGRGREEEDEGEGGIYM
jgi:hypothetical protein